MPYEVAVGSLSAILFSCNTAEIWNVNLCNPSESYLHASVQKYYFILSPLLLNSKSYEFQLSL